jgi:hypothetical protein
MTCPIGAKGVGESPNVGGVSAFSNAVNDAFAHLGVTHMPMPHDHWRVWQTAQRLGLTGSNNPDYWERTAAARIARRSLSRRGGRVRR